jgi:hypothetical protein
MKSTFRRGRLADTMGHNGAQGNKKYYGILFLNIFSYQSAVQKLKQRQDRKRSPRRRETIARRSSRRFLGEHEQQTTQLPSARHGTSPSAGGHVFTILKQHGRAAIVVPDNDSHLPNCSLFGLPVHVFRPANSIVEDLQAALAQLTRSLPLSRPHGFAHLCRSSPVGSIDALVSTALRSPRRAGMNGVKSQDLTFAT